MIFVPTGYTTDFDIIKDHINASSTPFIFLCITSTSTSSLHFEFALCNLICIVQIVAEVLRLKCIDDSTSMSHNVNVVN